MDANGTKMNREKLFREAIRENDHRIYRICCYFFPDRDDSNDAYQESLIRIWENLHSFRGKSMLSTWIYRVAVNTCLSYIRRDRHRNRLVVNGHNAGVFQVADVQDENTGTEEIKIAFLQRFMTDLTTADRTLVSLYLEDLSTKEMAEVTGISEANVRVRIHRIKEKIKKEWEENQHGTGRF